MTDIGQWDGTTASATILNPYDDPVQAQVAFGIISYDLMPWRSYCDTWPAARWLSHIGANWNVNNPRRDLILSMIASFGIKKLRVEVPWAWSQWDDTWSQDNQNDIASLMTSFAAHGIEPLILLNAHHGVPGPLRTIQITVAVAAHAGDTTIKLSEWSQVRSGYSGFSNPQYIACMPFIDHVDADGTAHLSTGLPYDVAAGVTSIQDLKYQPFQPPTLADGSAVPASAETLAGWRKYASNAIRSVLQHVSHCRVEVWNELSFGSDFLDRNNYYDVKIQYGPPMSYGGQTGYYVLIPITMDELSGLSVDVFDGFSNQSPWMNGAAMSPGQSGFSRHFYTGGFIDVNPNNQLTDPGNGVVNAQGGLEGQQTGNWLHIVPGTDFTPTFRDSFPEFWHSGLKTEGVWRDIVPDTALSNMPDYAGVHGRFSRRPDTLQTAKVIQSESNYTRSPFVDSVKGDLDWNDPAVQTFDEWLQAKSGMRQYTTHCHKGLDATYMFCMDAGADFGILTNAYLAKVNDASFTIADQLNVVPLMIKHIGAMQSFMSGSQAIEEPRPIHVSKLIEYKPRLIMAGDGSTQNPDRTNKDMFAFYPFQKDDRTFVIPYYVMTEDLTHVWDATKGPLDPARYTMPDQDFEITIDNVNGQAMAIYAFDLFAWKWMRGAVTARSTNSVSVRVPTTDTPRILILSEADPGTQFDAASVQRLPNGAIEIKWTTANDSTASVSYGPDIDHRDANVIGPLDPAQVGVVVLPAQDSGCAVQIDIVAAGLTCRWPRYHQDGRGVVAPK